MKVSAGHTATTLCPRTSGEHLRKARPDTPTLMCGLRSGGPCWLSGVQDPHDGIMVKLEAQEGSGGEGERAVSIAGCGLSPRVLERWVFAGAGRVVHSSIWETDTSECRHLQSTRPHCFRVTDKLVPHLARTYAARRCAGVGVHHHYTPSYTAAFGGSHWGEPVRQQQQLQKTKEQSPDREGVA